MVNCSAACALLVMHDKAGRCLCFREDKGSTALHAGGCSCSTGSHQVLSGCGGNTQMHVHALAAVDGHASDRNAGS